MKNKYKEFDITILKPRSRMNGIEPVIDIDKQQIITLFNNNVKG